MSTITLTFSNVTSTSCTLTDGVNVFNFYDISGNPYVNGEQWSFNVDTQTINNYYQVSFLSGNTSFSFNSQYQYNDSSGNTLSDQIYSGNTSTSFTIYSVSSSPQEVYCLLNESSTLSDNYPFTNMYVTNNGSNQWYLSPNSSSSSSSDSCTFTQQSNSSFFTFTSTSNTNNLENIGIIGSLAGVMQYANPQNYTTANTVTCVALTYYANYQLNNL